MPDLSVPAPPQPRQGEPELLIREARARRRKRWLGGVALVAVVTGAALGIASIVAALSPQASSRGGHRSAIAGSSRCGVQVRGVRILRAGQLVYREPVSRTMGHQVECSGPTVWVVFFNGLATSQEGYFGVRSGDRGHTWRVVFAERFFGLKAPHQLDAYLAAWTLNGPRDAYFTGRCPACGYGTVSLWITRDSGRAFRMYKVPALTGYAPTSVRVSGDTVTIRAKRILRKIGSPPYEIYGYKAVKLRAA